MRPLKLLFGLLLSLIVVAEAQANYSSLKLEDGTELSYALLLPNGFEAGRTYPVLLALPPGPQTRDMVEAGLGYWRSGPSRGWVVVSPVAPGPLFFQGAEVYLPALLDEVAETVTFEGGRVHVAGVSNGGRSTFRFALEYPELVHSLLVLPGFPPDDEDFARLERLKGKPVTLFAGEFDSSWVEQMKRTEERLKTLGIEVSATVVSGEGHVIQSLDGATLFEILEGFRTTTAN